MECVEEKINHAIITHENNITKREDTDRRLKRTSKKIYIIGKNTESYNILNKYKITALIDDNKQDKSKWNGIPIVKTDEVPGDCIVINCSTSIRPIQVTKNLKLAGIKEIIEIHELISEDQQYLPTPWFVSQQRNELKSNLPAFKEIYRQLSDDKSREIALDVVRFRLTANPSFMLKYELKPEKQYFEEFLNISNEIFVDGGGYNGDTTEAFMKLYPCYKEIHLFEPSQPNILVATQKLRGIRNITIHALALSDSDAKLSFNSDKGPSSAVNTGGAETVSAVTMDQILITRPVSFIKLDIEGWEINALRGAENIIRRNKPKIAVAVYHAAKDFWDIPNYILSISPSYKVKIRHYTEGWSETVMYFF